MKHILTRRHIPVRAVIKELQRNYPNEVKIQYIDEHYAFKAIIDDVSKPIAEFGPNGLVVLEPLSLDTIELIVIFFRGLE